MLRIRKRPRASRHREVTVAVQPLTWRRVTYQVEMIEKCTFLRNSRTESKKGNCNGRSTCQLSDVDRLLISSHVYGTLFLNSDKSLNAIPMTLVGLSRWMGRGSTIVHNPPRYSWSSKSDAQHKQNTGNNVCAEWSVWKERSSTISTRNSWASCSWSVWGHVLTPPTDKMTEEASQSFIEVIYVKLQN